MKKSIRLRYQIEVAGLLMAVACQAQSGLMLTSFVSFNGTNGVDPEGDLALGMDGLIHGTLAAGGQFGFGDVFESTLGGTFTVVSSFNGTNGSSPTSAPLPTPGGDSYGTTMLGGNGFDGSASSGMGTVYKLGSNGVISTLFAFSGTNGDQPISLIYGSDGNLYGTTVYGGAFTNITTPFGQPGSGTVFRIATNGDFSLLASFDGTNGSLPRSLLQGFDGNFYGVAEQGGSNGLGTVFRMTPDGNVTTLFAFAGTNGALPITLMQGSDGGLYGTAITGGPDTQGHANGAVFRITTNGVFNPLGFFTNANGISPIGKLTEVCNGVFYGTTSDGGENAFGDAFGTLYQVTTNGDLKVLVAAFGFSDPLPAHPNTGVLKAPDGNFYGGFGAGLFAIRPIQVPVLQSSIGAGQINLSWQAWAGYTYVVDYATNLNSSFGLLMNQIEAQTNGDLTISDPIGVDPQRFYRVTFLLP